MIAELDLFGVLVPAVLAWALVALVLTALGRRLLLRAGLYARLWHAPLFEVSAFVILLGAVVALAGVLAR